MKHDPAQSRFGAYRHNPHKRTFTPSTDHPAITEARTMYPSRRTAAGMMDRLLISGHNNRKIGKKVIKGPWAGMPIYTLTLEERATCPTTCHMWRDCYGNNMHWPKRIKHGAELEGLLTMDVAQFAEAHPQGFVVRLHVLGDFYSGTYVDLWHKLLNRHPELHVYGYTARNKGTGIGRMIELMNLAHPERCAIRWSVRPGSCLGMDARIGMAATVVGPDEAVEAASWGGVICPVDTDRTACCATCGLCWSPAARDKPIVFLKHGRGVRS